MGQRVFIVSIGAVTSLMREELQLTEQTLTDAGSAVTASMSRDLIAGRRTEVAVFDDFAEQARAAGAPARLIELSALALCVHNHRVLTARTP